MPPSRSNLSRFAAVQKSPRRPAKEGSPMKTPSRGDRNRQDRRLSPLLGLDPPIRNRLDPSLASHLRSFRLDAYGCGAGIPVRTSALSSVQHWYVGPADNDGLLPVPECLGLDPACTPSPSLSRRVRHRVVGYFRRSLSARAGETGTGSDRTHLPGEMRPAPWFAAVKLATRCRWTA